MNRLIEFFIGEGNLLSMGRLLPFLSFFPSSYVVIKTQNEVIFGWYVSAFAAMYIGGKGMDGLRELPSLKGRQNAPNRD